MATESKCLLIKDKIFQELIKTYYQQSYSTMLLSYICLRNNLETTLTVAEANTAIGLSPRQINDARNRCQIRFVNCGTFKLYSAYDLAMLAANLQRKRKVGILKNIQRVTVLEQPEPEP